jgi:hypothetical protein
VVLRRHRCHPPDRSPWMIKDGQYQVFLENEWVKVPPEKLVKGNNRVGLALAWRMYLDGQPAIHCFMPGTSG